MTTLAGFTIPRNPSNEIPVCNYSGSVIPKWSVLAKDATNTTIVQSTANPGLVGRAVIVSAAGSIPVGVAIEDIPAAVNGVPGTGPMQITGFVTVINSVAGAIADGAAVVPDTGGQVKTNPGSVPVLGVAWSAGAAQADLIDIQLMLSPTL
jgi:hypothetical protein